MSRLRKRVLQPVMTYPVAMINDPRLSYRTLGLLTRLLELPDGQPAHADDLTRDGREPIEEIHTALEELARAGYCLFTGDGEITHLSDTAEASWADLWREADR